MPCERDWPRSTTLTSSKPAGPRLASPLPEGASREPLLIQIFFAGELIDEQIGRVLQAELEQTRQPLALYGSMYQSLTGKLGTLTAKRRVGFFRLLTLEFGIALNQAYPAWPSRCCRSSAVARTRTPVSAEYVMNAARGAEVPQPSHREADPNPTPFPTAQSGPKTTAPG